MPNLTTTEAAALLSERGKAIKPDTVKHWCQQGRFPNAQRVGGTRRGYWLIPEADLEGFELPKVGNPGNKRGPAPHSAPCGARKGHGDDAFI